MQNRENVLQSWIKNIPGNTPYELTPLAGDASFRRYFRLHNQETSFILMDAPPEKESIIPFLQVAKMLAKTGVITPGIHAVNEKEGFILLDDFGDTLFLKALTSEKTPVLYQTALETLIKIQECRTDNPALPAFDKAHMLQEMSLFRTWFLEKYLNLTLTEDEEKLLTEMMENLAESISMQPQVFIHRDYHSRNLMVLKNSSDLGVLDFQDAMRGPATYDLVSILKDCYITWPREQVLTWAHSFHASCPALSDYSYMEFIKAFDFSGLQRHLKVLGIFCRLYLRDGKPGYLNDLPLTLDYVLECTALYKELKPLHNFLQARVSLP